MEKYTPPLNPESIKTASSKEMVIVKNLIEKHADLETFSEDAVRSDLSKNQKMKVFNLTIDSVIDEMKKMGYFAKPAVEEVEPGEPEPIMISHRRELPGIKEIEDEEIRQLLEQNILLEEADKDFFESDEDLETVYEQAKALEKNRLIESPEYYQSFELLVEGGGSEIKKDLQDLARAKDRIKKTVDALSEKDRKKYYRAKKIATIVERGIAYGGTVLEWLSANATIDTTSEFDDVLRSIDEVLQIRKKGEQNTFLGLGVDATYRGYLSKEYADKFIKLLESIKNGNDIKIKYFKNHQGEMMEEFVVPKIVLYFDRADVKNLIKIVRNSSNPEVIEELKNSPQKFALIGQVVNQCELLANYAAECRNYTFKKYDDVVEAIKLLGKEDPEIQAMLDVSHEDVVFKHMKYLLDEFKKDKSRIAA